MLAKSAVLACIDLAARILEESILDKRAELGIKKVIEPGKRIEREVRVISPAASVECFAVGPCERETIGFRVVNARPGTDIRLELPSWRPKSQNEVKQPHATIKPVTRVGTFNEITIGFP
jgi:hypothetical protein